MHIETIFCDIGGVLLTNGWDRDARKLATEHFKLDAKEFEARHKEVVDDLERGELTLESYMRHVVFSTPRPFTSREFQEFMFSRSQLLGGMIDFLREVKERLGCKIGALSNEGKELASYRIEKFGLKKVFDYFIVSSFVGFAKPDERIYHLAVNVSQSHPSHILYIDDRVELIDAGKRANLKTILHHSESDTRSLLESMIGRSISS